MSSPPPITPVRVDAGPHEAKFVVPAAAVHRVASFLRQRLPRDDEYPDAWVTSLYFDTPGLRFVGDKEGSDYLKTKIRIRWYADPRTKALYPDAFLEAKFKEGARRAKVRIPLPGRAPEIASMGLADRGLRPLIERLAERGVDVPPALVPLILIRYRRRRFVLPRVRARVCIDSDIRTVAAHPSLGAIVQTPLPEAVLEIKGAERVLPPELLPLSGLGARLASFSKYLRCVDAARSRR